MNMPAKGAKRKIGSSGDADNGNTLNQSELYIPWELMHQRYDSCLNNDRLCSLMVVCMLHKQSKWREWAREGQSGREHAAAAGEGGERARWSRRR